jgi:hypothetical protein
MIHHIRMIKQDLKPQRKDLSNFEEPKTKSLLSKIKALLSLTK